MCFEGEEECVITQAEFNLVFEKQVERCEQTLQRKKKEYTGDSQDRLSAFKVAAAMQGCKPERALAGMMAKHIVSLYDMCYADRETFDMTTWDEKITDSLNYLFLLKAIVEEEQNVG
jgi:beta-galactosidase/beta-glucuronidase